jgi:hypothetical protein
VETVKLSAIVMRLTPELYPSLRRHELESEIVLKFGLEALEADDAIEIINFSISEHQKQVLLH